MPFKSKQQRKWMYATHPEMAEKWEKHTPKNTKLPKRVKRKRKKKASFISIIKIAALYKFAAELKDRFDYLRKVISFLITLEDDTQIFAPIVAALKEPRQFSWKNAQEDIKDILKALYDLRKEFMRRKKWKQAQIIQHEYQALSQLGEKSQEYYRQFLNMPRREFAKPSVPPGTEWDEGRLSAGYLYHGTNPADAYSVLRSGKFYKGSAFSNLSLTSDLTVAAKFGNVIFVFDPKILQRRRAKKQRYFPEKQYLEMANSGLPSEEYKRPYISDIYRYEREWIVPLPFEFDRSDLDKIIILKQSKEDDSENVSNTLKTVAQDIPIEIQYLPAYSQHSSSTMEWDDVKYGELKHFVYDNVIKYANIIKKLAKDIGQKRAKEIKEKYKGEDENSIKYFLQHDDTIRTANSFYNILPHMSHNSHWWGKHDLDGWIRDIQNATHNIDNLNNTIFEPLIAPMEQLKNSIVPLRKAFTDTYLRTEEDYINGILEGGKYGLGPYKDSYVEWIRRSDFEVSRLKLLHKIINMPQYKEHFSDHGAASIETILENIGEDAKHVPMSVWREYPRLLARNPELNAFSWSFIENVFLDNPKVDKYLKESILPGGWVWDAASEGNKKVLNMISDRLKQLSLPFAV